MRLSVLILCLFALMTLAAGSQDYPDEFCLCEKQTISSRILGQERLLFVYLPRDYHEKPGKKYPVHYVADAPATSNLYHDLMHLHALMNLVPSSIIVGLSSDGRDTWLNPDRNAIKYLKFIENEAIPFIDEHYRTTPNRTLAGHSLGGLFTLHAMVSNPSLFDAYIAGSPGPPETAIRITAQASLPEHTGRHQYLYTSTGSDESPAGSRFRELSNNLEALSNDRFNIHCAVNEGENHISNMAVNFQKAFGYIYEDWNFILPDTLEKPAVELIIDHYDRLEKMHNYRPAPDPEKVLFPAMDQLARRGDFDNAIKIILYCIELFPDSDQAYAYLAKAHFDTGKPQLGLQYLNKSLELNPGNELAKYMKSVLENR